MDYADKRKDHSGEHIKDSAGPHLQLSESLTTIITRQFSGQTTEYLSFARAPHLGLLQEIYGFQRLVSDYPHNGKASKKYQKPLEAPVRSSLGPRQSATAWEPSEFPHQAADPQLPSPLSTEAQQLEDALEEPFGVDEVHTDNEDTIVARALPPDAHPTADKEWDTIISVELKSTWILNLSMRYKDATNREKFYFTYRKDDWQWLKVTVFVDYRNAPEGSLERELCLHKNQREKAREIYEALRDSLGDIVFYDTCTYIKLKTLEGKLHLHVFEDTNETIHYLSRKDISHLGVRTVREKDIEFKCHLSGYVYRVRVGSENLVRKDISGPDTVGDFLYEANALHCLGYSAYVVNLYGLVVDEQEMVKGLLLYYVDGGALVDVIYDSRERRGLWDLKSRWARQIIHGLADIHESGFILGDMTLSNIVIDNSDNAVLVDINRRGISTGWVPPEAKPLIGKQPSSFFQGVKSDLFQLGMVLWALATDNGEPEKAERPLIFGSKSQVPSWYQNITAICLDRDPRKRLQASQLLQMIHKDLTATRDTFLDQRNELALWANRLLILVRDVSHLAKELSIYQRALGNGFYREDLTREENQRATEFWVERMTERVTELHRIVIRLESQRAENESNDNSRWNISHYALLCTASLMIFVLPGLFYVPVFGMNPSMFSGGWGLSAPIMLAGAPCLLLVPLLQRKMLASALYKAMWLSLSDMVPSRAWLNELQLRGYSLGRKFYRGYDFFVRFCSRWYRRWLNFTMPVLKEGHRRIQWTCDCGVHLHADFPDDGSEELSGLAFSLQNPGQNHRQTTGAQSSSSGQSNSNQPKDSLEKSSSITGSHQQGSAEVKPGPTATPVASSEIELKQPMFLGMCINLGGIYKTLAEIDVSNMNSDAAIFLAMKKEYLEGRGLLARFRFLIKPITIEFVRFTLWNLRSGYISVCERPNSIPPDDYNNYEYIPKPLKPLPPMPPEIFIHYLQHNEGDLSPGRNDWLPRLPKRLSKRVIDSDEACYGWGIHIIEGPNREVIFWISIFTIAGSVLAAILYSALMQDPQGGTGIGALMVALPPAILAAFLFRLGAL